MKKILAGILAIFLNILVIAVLYQMAENKQNGESTNIAKATGQTAHGIINDLVSGWNGE